MKSASFFWLYLLLLACVVAACTRNGYPTVATGAAVVKSKLVAANLRPESDSIAQVVQYALAAVQPAISAPLYPERSARKHSAKHGCRAASTQQTPNSVALRYCTIKHGRPGATTRPHTTNTAAKTDYDGAVAVFYAMIVAGIIVVLSAVIFFAVRWFRKRKLKY